MRYKLILPTLFAFLFAAQTNAQSSGYRLEFHSAMTLSADSTAIPVLGADRIKSFTVPAGCVLKVTSGMITSNVVGGAYILQSFLIVNGQKILGRDSRTATTNAVSGVTINGDNPIWVPEGTTVSISVARGTSTGSVSDIANNWISGVVFKLVAN